MRKLLVTCDRCGHVLYDSKKPIISKITGMPCEEPSVGQFPLPYNGCEHKDYCQACCDEIEAFNLLSQREKHKALHAFVTTPIKRTKKVK